MVLSRVLVCLSLVFLVSCNDGEFNHQTETVPDGRLPGDVIPLNYELHLEMNPDSPGFSGYAAIRAELTKVRSVIWLHGKNLNVSAARVALEDGTVLEARYAQVHADGVAKLALPREIEPQTVTLLFNYRADYYRGLHGAYRVREADEWYVFTQFEPIAARLVFPGFDEPAHKTPFAIEITVPAGNKVIANTPSIGTENLANGLVRHAFAPSRPMPTYLLAFAIGPLDIVEAAPIPPSAVRDRSIPLRGVAVKGKGGQLAYALDNTAPILEALEAYFGIPYPYEKLDLIAVPDFAAGAMENAGAITYREILLLIDPRTAPAWQIRRYFSVHAHELAHQWFGNLVTMPWWDDIWLNEAFATWMAAKVIETLKPGHQPQLAMFERMQRAMAADALTSARQIRQPITDSHDIENAFDSITYSKGGAVLDMFEHYVGEDDFRAGIGAHLRRFAWGNADVHDFLASISAAAGEDIAPAFKSFLFQPGIPLIKTQVECGTSQASVRLSQSRYLPAGSSGDTDARWGIPVCLKYGAAGAIHKQCVLLEQSAMELDLGGQCPQWLLPNAEGVGYYHWTLDGDGYQRLHGRLHAAQPALSMPEQLAIVASVKAGFNAGRLDTEQALTALMPYATSGPMELAEAPLPLFAYILDYLLDGEPLTRARTRLREIYATHPVVDGFNPARVATEPSRRLFLAELGEFLAVTARDPAVREAAAAAGRSYIGFETDGQLHPEAVTPEFFPLALQIAGHEGGPAYFDALLAHFKASDNALFRAAALKALAGAGEPELAVRARSLALDPSLRRNEIVMLLDAQFAHPDTRDAAWDWLKRNLRKLLVVMPPDHAARLPRLAARFCHERRAEEVEHLLAEPLAALPGGPRNLAQSLEAIRLCAALRRIQQPAARDHFGSR